MCWLVKRHLLCCVLVLCVGVRLLQARLEKEEFEEELKEMQEKVTTMKQQTPDPKQTQTISQVYTPHIHSF